MMPLQIEELLKLCCPLDKNNLTEQSDALHTRIWSVKEKREIVSGGIFLLPLTLMTCYHKIKGDPTLVVGWSVITF